MKVICKICNKQIRENDTISVISTPIKCISDSGEYALVGGDFFEKEVILHSKCLSASIPNLDQILLGNISHKPNISVVKSNTPIEREEMPAGLLEKLQEAIKELGGDREEYSKSALSIFLIKHSDCKDLETLMSRWFEQRNKF